MLMTPTATAVLAAACSPRFAPRLPLARWLACASLLAQIGATPASGRADVILNEIHYAPDVKTERVEFIELYNRGPDPVELSNWAFTSGVQFVFPAGTVLPAGGYLVVAQDPSVLKAKYGANALGPWSGGLSAGGENVVLQDAAGKIVDEVDYQLGFPWPTVGEAPGYSIELIHPTADNDLGGHWRASFTGGGQQQNLLLLDSGAEWRIFKGTEAPPPEWHDRGFNDSSWSAGPAPVGYDPDVRMGTPLADMRNGYIAFFLRRTFNVTDAAAVTGLALEALYDDGFKLWINGTNLLNAALPAGEVPFNQPASPVRENNNYDKLDVPLPAGVLREGENVIALQVANLNVGGSSDCFFDCRLRAVTGPTGQGPTPGRLNSVFTVQVPPAFRQVQHAPKQPHTGEPVVVSAKVTAAAGIASVSLQYQIVDPGSYLELTDPAYPTTWLPVPMNDAGVGGDATAGDDVFTATLPSSLQQHRRLLRYRLVATDRTGRSAQAPYADDPQPNFAYFCYDRVPAWTGAVRPGATGALGQPFTVNEAEMNRLPTYHLLAKKQAVEDCTWYDRSHGDEYFWQGTLVYDGEVYDHIRFRPRGGVWRYAMGKNMWKFDFNRGHDFQPRDNWGRRLDTGWTKLNLGACIQQGDYLHRGEQGLFESVGFRLFQLVGQPAMHTAFVQFRIIDEPLETKPGDQYTGDFWGLYLALEQPDGRFLDERGLPDGNLYKMEGGWGTPNNIGPAGPTDYSDLQAFLSAYDSNPPESWWRTNLNLSAYFGYQTIIQAIHHYDIADGKNYFYYRDPEAGPWTVFPWDLDLTWADNMYRSGQTGGDEPFKSRLLSNFSNNPTKPNIAREFRNRVREIRDLLWNPDEVFRLIDEYARLVRGTNTASIIDADRSQWDYNPLMNNGNIVNTGKAGTGRFYQKGTPTKTFEGMVQLMKNYVGYRATNASFSLDKMATEPQRPQQPALAYTGPAGFPANRLAFRASAFSGSAFASVKWRIAEITRASHPGYRPGQPEPYEITPTWESEDLASPAVDFTFPAGVARIGHLYRVRVRYLDTAGRTSNWSPPVAFTAGPTDTTESLGHHLRISELMYNPPDGSDFEFIELHNSSPSEALDLAGVTFTAGLSYAFPAGATLAPGGYLLVVRAAADNGFAAFRAYYGLDAAVPIFGPYTGSLANEGETLTLKTAANGASIFSFSYSDGRGWPVAADGAGHSLIPDSDAVGGQASGWLDYGGNWRASAYRNGSPGRADPLVPPGMLISEVMAHTHEPDPAHPEVDSNDWIELFNAGNSPVELAGWYLSDDPANLRKWAIPAVTVPVGQFVSFDEITGFHGADPNGFGLNQAGEQVVLSHWPGNGRDRVVDAVSFKAQELAYSWGRVDDRRPGWTRLIPSRGGPVAQEAPLAVVINELMYHPRDLRVGTNLVDNVQDEFIELNNPTAQGVALFDTNGVWRLDGGIRFLFPTNTSIPAGGYVLVVPFNPTNAAELDRFRQHYRILSSSPTFLGPYEGKLGNRSDRVALEKPLQPDRVVEDFGWAILDEVIYSSGWPWPRVLPDGQGHSLQRLGPRNHGNQVENWQAAAPTPGTRDLNQAAADADSDALPDPWETAHALDPLDAARDNGAGGDPDDDGLTNLQEVQAGTDPHVPSLALLAAEWTREGFQLRFNQPANLAVRLESRDAVADGVWASVMTYAAQAEPQILRLTDPAPPPAQGRFYRVVAP